METTSSDRLITIPDVADRLAVSKRTVERLVAAGEIAVVRLGGSIRFLPADIDELVRRRRTGGTRP